MQRLLTTNKHTNVDEKERVQQVLDDVEEDAAQGLVAIHGARDSSADAVLALVARLHPLKASGALRQHELRDRKAANDGAVTSSHFMDNCKLLSDWIQSHVAHPRSTRCSPTATRPPSRRGCGRLPRRSHSAEATAVRVIDCVAPPKVEHRSGRSAGAGATPECCGRRQRGR